MDTVLTLFKHDLGITHNLRDEFFLSIVNASKLELERKGITLDLNSIDDKMLISDYAAYNYRNRIANVPLSMNLQLRIRNRIIKSRGVLVAENQTDSR